MLTRKDFINLADMLHEARPWAQSSEGCARDEHDKLIARVADWCAIQNPRFDRAKFIARVTR